MKKTRALVVWFTLVLALMSGCAASRASQAPAVPSVLEQADSAPSATPPTLVALDYQQISAAELHTQMVSKDFTLVNVHVPYEGELPQTDAQIPYNEIGERQSQLPADKAAKVVLYCRTGGMSAEAAQTLADLGYTNVYELRGGFEAWRQAAFSLEVRSP